VAEKGRGVEHLRIAVIAHALRQGGGLSAGRSVIRALVDGSEHRYLFTLPDMEAYRSIPFAASRHEVVFYRRRGGLLGRWMYDTFELERVVRRFRPARILALGNRGIHNPPCPQAVLLRDAHMFYPRRHFGHELLRDRLKVGYQKWRFARDLRHTHLVFCQTEVARRRFEETHRYPGRIAIAGNAIAPEALTQDPVPAPPLALPEDGFRLFFLGSYYPHKNHEAVVEMFERHPDALEGVVVMITVSSEQHPNAQRVLERIRTRGLDDRIVNLGPLSQHEIAAVYGCSDALILPTLLESFSRTYLEAMEFGVPILTSDLDFAHGICADAALYFDPFDSTSMLRAITRLRDDPSLRERLVARGRARLAASRQTWEDIAAVMLREVERLDHVA
jgi:glycosyltransferase involved in cell wall biosynthesis